MQKKDGNKNNKILLQFKMSKKLIDELDHISEKCSFTRTLTVKFAITLLSCTLKELGQGRKIISCDRKKVIPNATELILPFIVKD